MPPTDVEETATLPLEGLDSVGQERPIKQRIGWLTTSLKQE